MEAALWGDSQHKHAMDHATEKSVLGDFSDATFDYDGVRSRFFRRTANILSRRMDRTESSPPSR